MTNQKIESVKSAVRSSAPTVIDRVLEGSIIGSFTKFGPAVRSRLQDWEPIDRDLSGKRIVVTGGSSGLGRYTAKALAERGADVVLTSRSSDKASSIAADIEDEIGESGSVRGLALNTAEFSSINQFVTQLELDGSPLDVLIHNAGALSDSYQTNESGMELTLASHLVGPYALTKMLKEHFAPTAKVLWMSSGGMYAQGLDVDELEMSEDSYRGSIAYARAKRAQVEMVSFLAPQWAPAVVMHTMHPGWVDTDGVSSGIPLFGKLMGPLLRDVESGADTMVWLASGYADEAQPGQFWLDREPRGTSYLPRTSTDGDEREALIEWLDLVTLPAFLTGPEG